MDKGWLKSLGTSTRAVRLSEKNLRIVGTSCRTDCRRFNISEGLRFVWTRELTWPLPRRPQE